MPITDAVHALCYESFSARTAVETLMARDTKPEV
jgi:glycerol-3-phosphate dehydrogenase